MKNYLRIMNNFHVALSIFAMLYTCLSTNMFFVLYISCEFSSHREFRIDNKVKTKVPHYLYYIPNE
jgi:hypothetical protein